MSMISRLFPSLDLNIGFLGPYGCPRKQLALLQMRGILNRIARDFDMALAPGEDGVAFDVEAKDAFTLAVKPLQMVFTKRAGAPYA